MSLRFDLKRRLVAAALVMPLMTIGGALAVFGYTYFTSIWVGALFATFIPISSAAAFLIDGVRRAQ